MNDMSHAPQPAQTNPHVRLASRVAGIADLFRSSARQTEEARAFPLPISRRCAASVISISSSPGLSAARVANSLNLSKPI